MFYVDLFLQALFLTIDVTIVDWYNYCCKSFTNDILKRKLHYDDAWDLTKGVSDLLDMPLFPFMESGIAAFPVIFH